MELYNRLVDIFEVPELNISRANRRTLLKYVKRTKFQLRREAFYSVCDGGKKSKVAICRTDERPTWVHNLETLKTKQLRLQLSGFLKNLGILVDPKYANIKKLAKEKNWHHVVYLDDESKTGGMPPPHGFVRPRGRGRARGAPFWAMGGRGRGSGRGSPAATPGSGRSRSRMNPAWWTC